MEDSKILDRWEGYHKQLMNEDNSREGRNEQQAEVEDDITEIASAEIEMSLRKMKSGKSTGPDN